MDGRLRGTQLTTQCMLVLPPRKKAYTALALSPVQSRVLDRLYSSNRDLGTAHFGVMPGRVRTLCTYPPHCRGGCPAAE